MGVVNIVRHMSLLNNPGILFDRIMRLIGPCTVKGTLLTQKALFHRIF